VREGLVSGGISNQSGRARCGVPFLPGKRCLSAASSFSQKKRYPAAGPGPITSFHGAKPEGQVLSNVRFRRLLGVVLHLVEVEILVDLFRHAVQVLGVLHVLRRRREFAQYRTNRCQFRRGQVHIGTIAQTVREVTGGGGQHRALGCHAGLVTHAQGAARHFGANTGGAVGVEVAFFHQLRLVHLGRRRHPQAGLQRLLVHLQQLASSAEVADVGR